MNKQLIKTDFFEAVNGEWIKKHEIPAHKSGIGSFEDIDSKLTKLKVKLFKEWSKDASTVPADPLIVEMVKYYNLVRDGRQRRMSGVKPILKLLKLIEGLNSWSDVANKYAELALMRLTVPVPFSIMTDFKNSDVETIYMSDPVAILPEKGYYSNQEKKDNLYAVWSGMAMQLLRKFNKDENHNKRLVELALKWDTIVSELLLSAEEYAVIANIYNPVSMDVVDSTIKAIKFSPILNTLTKQNVDTVVAVSKTLVEGYDKVLVEENFEAYKAFLYIQTIIEKASLLDYQTRAIAKQYEMALKGQKKPKSNEHTAIDAVTFGFYKMVFGRYYGKTFFGEENKKVIENMIQKMINIYKHRLENNTWLSEATKAKAVLKLNKMEVYVGYPEKIDAYYEKFIVKHYEGWNDLFENSLEFTRIIVQSEFDKFMKKVDKDLWSMTPAMVNAYFSPTQNKIVFPAGILQAPFYSSKQSSSANYGGIGAVIAHEISHAFDNNGANFDENGNMINWWTEEDRKQFDLRAEKMVELFNGVKTEYGKCNGRLTVSENIADAGGMSCAFEAAQSESDFNIKDFYINFATIWKCKYREQLAKMLLETDVHAPGKLRANVQIKNSDGFYEAFDVKKGDEMYLAPEKRVKIW
ncbi:M13 family metallopeptidase [Metamycoplasma neophronis]|uniref:M13 family metallopeptidase n=1 Tax=Metamycoplasma neophronis TaxID=872983 RepID=A0ABY2Z4C7_9BACT|nr:M13 family metallopeptidase [Metamycoplasma neophronis]TPR53852.1 M13 family metallopeptidase [Metamycoplasma neophronis]